MKIKFSSVFEADFAEIVAYLATEASLAVSVRFENRLIEAVEVILQTPEIGRRRKDLKGDVRSFRVAGFDNYLLFYQVRTADVFFIRVLHGAINLPAMFPY